MKKLVSKLQEVTITHLQAYDVNIDTKQDSDVMYKLKLHRSLEITGVTIYIKAIKRAIKKNFTIFERILFGEKILNAAVMVISSTIINLIKSKWMIKMISDFPTDKMTNQLEYSKRESDLDIIISYLQNVIIPYKDRNKYIIQPNITVNLKSKLPVIFSNILLIGFLNSIGCGDKKIIKGRKM